MYKKEMQEIITKVIEGNVDKKKLTEYIIKTFDCEKIYESGEMMITDAFFALKHYASDEERITMEEWLYFLECLLGEREYNLEEKISILTKLSLQELS